MRRAVFISAAVMALATAAVIPAGATDVSRVSWHGFNADAVFRVEEGDVVTDIDVGFITGRVTGELLPGTTVELPVATVAIEVHDGEALLLQAFGLVGLDTGEYSLDRTSLRAASLATTVPVVDADGNAFDVTVDVEWTAWGPYEHQVGGTRVPSESITHFVGKARSFMSASGTVGWPAADWNLVTDGGFIMKASYLAHTVTR